MTTQHCLSVWFVGIASPPVQCSNTGLEMRNKKCWVVAMSENPTDVLLSKYICNNSDECDTCLKVVELGPHILELGLQISGLGLPFLELRSDGGESGLEVKQGLKDSQVKNNSSSVLSEYTVRGQCGVMHVCIMLLDVMFSPHPFN